MLGTMNAVTQAVQGKFDVLRPLLDERTRRLWAATEARAIGRGGIARVAEATGMSRGTVRAGVRELDSGTRPELLAGGSRVRAPGGGRKALVDHDPGLVKALERLLDPFTGETRRGHCAGPAAARRAWRSNCGGRASSQRAHGESPAARAGLQLAGQPQDDRGSSASGPDAQFRRIARRVRAFQRLGQPVASIDTKKKELIGQYRNDGQEWRPKGQPEAVKVHDFIDPELGKAIPTGSTT